MGSYRNPERLSSSLCNTLCGNTCLDDKNDFVGDYLTYRRYVHAQKVD